MTIQKLLKNTNEKASLKRSLGMDAAGWTMESILRDECKKGGALVIGEGDEVEVKIGGLYCFPISLSSDGKRWEQGWI